MLPRASAQPGGCGARVDFTITSRHSKDRCLYCGELGEANTVEHFLPERLGMGHPFFLPRGAVCNRCQRWASQDIDAELVRVEADWLGLTRMKGKRGSLGEIGSRGSGRKWAPRIGSLHVEEGEPKRASKEHAFFCRALIKAALGAIYYCAGAEVALDGRLDTIREYARRGSSNFGYKYCHAYGRWLDDQVGLRLGVERDENDAIYSILQFYTQTFWVPLEPTIRLPSKFSNVPGLRLSNDLGEYQVIGSRTILTITPEQGAITARLHWYNEIAPNSNPLQGLGELLQSFNSRSPPW